MFQEINQAMLIWTIAVIGIALIWKKYGQVMATVTFIILLGLYYIFVLKISGLRWRAG